MKKDILTVKLLFLITVFFILSCESDPDVLEQEIVQEQNVSQKIIDKLEKVGFYTGYGLHKFQDGYIVESDIFLTETEIDELIADQESGQKHYRTHQLVNVPQGQVRTLNVFFDPAFSPFMQNAFNTALQRYNNLNLNLRFNRVNNIQVNDIRILGASLPPLVLGVSAGFPTNGNPGRTIGLNQFFFNNINSPDAITIIAHEIGHAIGFRHTDFMNRSFSCNGDPINEGAGANGANHIPGTPTGPDANSWMLACSNLTDRPFTTNDQIALRVLYPAPSAPPTPTTGSLNRTTGEYKAEPGSRIKLDYFASPGAPCYEREELNIRVIGANPNLATIERTFNGATASSISGSKTFTMPASGIVRITAEIEGGNGCSRANIKFNNVNRIELGTGGYGKRKFP